MKYTKLFLLLFALSAFSACKKDNEQVDPAIQLQTDIDLIETYLADNNLVAESTPSGLYYIINEEGNGNHPTINDVVSVNYKGYFLDGQVFDQTTGNPAIFPLGNVIAGWQEGIQLFKKGGNGILLIPSQLAYGSNPRTGIPANSVLVFDVELVNF